MADVGKVVDREERRETGTSLMLIGFICLAFAFLVMFFNPAAIRLGKLTMVEVAIGLVIVGFVLEIIGYRIRVKAS
jgi:hypothetical protein